MQLEKNLYIYSYTVIWRDDIFNDIRFYHLILYVCVCVCVCMCVCL